MVAVHLTGFFSYVLPVKASVTEKQKNKTYLKEYYEIVDEARPLLGLISKQADLFTEMHF